MYGFMPQQWKSIQKRRIKFHLTDKGARNLWEILYLANRLDPPLTKQQTRIYNDLSHQYAQQTKKKIYYVED